MNIFILILFSLFLSQQEDVIYKMKNPENLKLAANLLPNFWIASDKNCKAYFNIEENETYIKLECSDGISEFKVDFPIVMDYVNPTPVLGSSFVLEKNNINYTSNPEENLHLKMIYSGNNILKVILQAKNFNWQENFIINFEKEIACLEGEECGKKSNRK